MGLLDDAIREHLELKRRRGADPTEIECAEREALGPVRRRYDESDAPDLEPEPLAAEEPLPEEGTDEHWHEPMTEAAPSGPHEALGEHEEFDESAPPEHWHDEDPFRPPSDHPQAAVEPPLHGLDAETSEYDVAAEHEAEEDDMLEETPEFLQDTPDHDRLWFEQRPPRDFDFDG
jgi:hypothetical protein